jgi:4-hydroxy-tetrahydrodipicolinate synthase
MPTPPAGILPAVITPFREDDERIDYKAWQNHIEMLLASGVHGLFVIGGQGEFFTLSEEERQVAARFCAQTVANRVPVYVNVGSITTGATVRLAQAAETDGADYAVVITPYYIQPTADELVEHYVEVCRSVRIPVFAYNIPERTGNTLTPAIIQRIAVQCENFIGLKDSSGKLDEIPAYTAADLRVFIGRDHMILAGLKLGCAGAVTACSNVIPRAFVDLYDAFQAGDLARAERLQAMVEPLRQAFGLHTFPSVIKEAMNMAGMPAGRCRRPVGPMPEAARAKLAAVLEPLQAAGYLPSHAGAGR